jgi:predicted dinucleotide-binding enzyme
MKVAVIGAGNVGGTLGRRWSESGHEVVFGVREPAAGKTRDLLDRCAPGTLAVTPGEAAAVADVVVLAVWWDAIEDVVAALGDLAGKIVIDCTNPLDADLRLALGHDDSGGEAIARLAPGARVVKAFNTITWEAMADPRYGDRRATLFFCGGDETAVEIVSGLIRDLDLDPVHVGGLEMSRCLEPLALLWITEFRIRRPGSDYAFALIERQGEDAK